MIRSLYIMVYPAAHRGSILFTHSLYMKLNYDIHGRQTAEIWEDHRLFPDCLGSCKPTALLYSKSEQKNLNEVTGPNYRYLLQLMTCAHGPFKFITLLK